MKRRAKIFLDVDIEGLLTDTLAVSDVVNFDCYESIVSSCQRVIAQYKNIKPECVHTTKLFYYKKRARSSRMNPSRIFTTTDVFRAIAEHPSGEIPIGVQWTIKGDKDDILQTETKQEISDKDYHYEPVDKRSLRKPLIEDTLTEKDDDDEDYIPEKRRKIQNTQPENKGSDKSKRQAIINLEPNTFYRNIVREKRATPPPPLGPTVPDSSSKPMKPSRQEKGYRKYSPENLLQAYNLVKKMGLPVDKAARMFGVPPQTLRDRVLGKIDPVNYCTGGKQLRTNEEEHTLINHVENSVEQGDVCTNVALQKAAGELAFTFGKRKVKKALSNNWMTGFRHRWDDRLSAVKPRRNHSSQTMNSTSIMDEKGSLSNMSDELDVQLTTTSNPQLKGLTDFSGDDHIVRVLKRQGKPGDASSSNYRWPDDIRCELLMKYGGITERQNLPFSLVTDILTMVKEYFCTVGHTRLNTNTGLAGPVESGNVQAKLDEMNSAIQEKIAERKKRKHPITYIQDAKMEIFRTFSTLNLSKARFNELLDWVKSLELQEGKQGRFFLTERNKLGSGLQVHYDTDATAAQKLNEIHRMRSKLNVPKTLHPVDLNSRLTVPAQAPTTTQPEQVNPPIMLLMPSGNATVPTTLTQFLPSNLKVIPTPSVSVVNGKAVSSTVTSQTQSSSTKSSIDNNIPVKSKDSSVFEKTKDSNKTQKSTPAILRRKRAQSKKDTEEKQDPVPLQLFKSYNRDSDAEGNILHDDDFIKKEPISYSDTEDDVTADPDYIPKGGKFDSGISGGGKYETIKEMLRTDAVMPQADDPDPDDQSDDSFKYVTIKSEPLDDY